MKKDNRDGKKEWQSAIGWRFLLPREEQDPAQALAVCCYTNRAEQDRVPEYVEELISLANSCDLSVLETCTWLLRAPSSSFYLNEGKLEEIERILEEFPTIGTLLIDEEISPSQQRNLEKRLRVVVLDRTELILEIFASRALTAEAGLQVELAQARYLLPRLKRMWGHLSRQKSGGSGGGFVKGEGEKQIELDRRIVRERIHKLSRDLKNVERQREERRKAKKRNQIPTFALIGYTNSGKSTLLNLLTSADTYVENKLFATLDPKTRRCVLPCGQRVLLTDTVGFIRKLPHTLVAAFKSTLEAALQEDILLHVVDASHPLALEYVETTKAILQELGITQPQVITVLNKMDKVADGVTASRLRLMSPNPVCVSAKTGEGIRELLRSMEDMVQEEYPQATLHLPYKEYGLFTELCDAGLVISHYYENDLLIVKAFLPNNLQKRYSEYIVE
ncbi:GTPase HflX [Chlamydia trachomatis]|uniref:GTPase HflX n=1 Tax=Chlamydia trachomatis serovar D (strain ATCC VR-885 / DSM 19411 / UW-3/Cx) TaxID=272561 RepID=O84383_CHLTR|nr:GTPase HflX [Chlamydia trachomatis]NP_219888.1 GTPase HflX [Chlamydia trachomatis D/UW-3/CX]AAC67975.1 GTP Binding Protein [Chlamydia trachomatis D/UW-3/CX]ADI51055.1 HflX [Chlamydia trachomatis D-EC]ADI52067.1 HflX [Chlamydia trachomatis D-LC]AGT69921.1 GTPase HflX [Chlamydia trachomatis]AKR41428.1 GTPase HflX [Chlamydia trachomatis]